MKWISKATRLPTQQDADPWGCVLVWHIHNGVQTLGWQNPMLKSSKYITHWMTPPPAPERGAAQCARH